VKMTGKLEPWLAAGPFLVNAGVQVLYPLQSWIIRRGVERSYGPSAGSVAESGPYQTDVEAFSTWTADVVQAFPLTLLLIAGAVFALFQDVINRWLVFIYLGAAVLCFIGFGLVAFTPRPRRYAFRARPIKAYNWFAIGILILNGAGAWLAYEAVA
jgi:hypothetical protein